MIVISILFELRSQKFADNLLLTAAKQAPKFIASESINDQRQVQLQIICITMKVNLI